MLFLVPLGISLNASSILTFLIQINCFAASILFLVPNQDHLPVCRVPICPVGHRMRRDGIEVAKGRMKFKCPKMNRENGCLSCTCETPCSNAKYGRTVHLILKDNPRLFNNPPRSSKEWKTEYNERTSVERSNKREKIDFKLESGRHRSTKMWYCRLYHIQMLQHLDAWDLPNESSLRKSIQQTA